MFFYSDDPVRDWDRYDRYQQRKLDGMPVCCECKHPIQGVVINTDFGETVCEECFDTFYREDEDE